MGLLVFELEDLYQRTFGTKPVVPKVQPGVDNSTPFQVPAKRADELFSKTGAPLFSTDLYGVEVWLPTEFFNLPQTTAAQRSAFPNGRLKLPYSVIRITGSSTIIRTPLAERRGSVKEQYNVDDYKITLKGFFLDKERRVFPEDDLKALKHLHESGQAFSIWNAITDIFLADPTETVYDQQQVVITSFELPEVEAGKRHVKPFVMQLESDNVFTLEVE